MIKIEKVVKNTRRPHEWRRVNSIWKCSICGGIAAEFDDCGKPEPYGTMLYAHGGVSLELLETTCEELAIWNVMDA